MHTLRQKHNPATCPHALIQFGDFRVIARPFVGEDAANFKRTDNRRDYTLPPPGPTLLDRLTDAQKTVCAVGKIDDIFAHRGITRSNHTHNNADSCDAMLDFIAEEFSGLLFVNLIEFDMIYGHRNDPRGYADALEAFDGRLPEIQARLQESDLAIIAADHDNNIVIRVVGHGVTCTRRG